MNGELQKFIEEGLIGFSVDITHKLNKSNEWKKEIKFPKEWTTTQTLDKHYYNSKYNGIAILTGKINGIIVLDIDSVDDWNKLLKENNKEEPLTIKVKSGSGGIHYYFKYTDDLECITSKDHAIEEYKIDIKTNGGCIIVPPSTYFNKKLNKNVEYKWECDIFEYELEEMPEWIKKLLLNKKSKKEDKKEIKNNIKKEVETDIETDIEEDIKNELIVKENKKEELIEIDKTKEQIFSVTMSQPVVYRQMFDKCYKQSRFEEYDSWISVGMALRNAFVNENDAFELFNYFSAKGNNYDGMENTLKKFNTFIKKKTNNKYTIATIYYYAIQDNKPKFIEIMNKNTFDLEQFDMCKYVKMLAGKIFIYIVKNSIYKLYCFNGRVWKKEDTLLKTFLSNELYEFLKMILVELYFEHREFNHMKAQIKKLKSASFKKDVVESYKEVNAREDIKLDSNPNLLGFENMVYDFEEKCFREYRCDDYVSTTTGYDWREPSEAEINKMNEIIESVMPDENERKTYLQILSTCLNGQALEKFIVFNGQGRNGKGMMNDLLLCALGTEYGMICNNNLLFEASKMGSNPEKANIHKKRVVIFREPPENKSFENSVIKELTGGGKFSARGHFESETQKELNLTMIVECNKKPLFKEEPTQADVMRLIDIYFRSTFTLEKDLVDKKNNVYLANLFYKTEKFQNQYKYALIKILLKHYHDYEQNEYSLYIAKTIQDRTQNYLELSYHIVSWFKENYEFTGKKEDIIKMQELYNTFSSSTYFLNMSKTEKKKYSKAYLQHYIENNLFFRKYYVEKTRENYHSLHSWQIKNN